MMFFKGLRNYNQGKLDIKKGGACSHKKKYRFIYFKRSLKNVVGIIKRIERDPNRSAFIALILYNNGFMGYIIATQNMRLGLVIYNYNSFFIPKHHELINGNNFCILNLPTGSLINHIELIPNMGACFIRSAGTTAKIIKKYNNEYTLIKLKSKEQRLINNKCFVNLGIVSNINNHLIKLKKAGQARWLGMQPHVRGRAKNPVDHPHGGRTNGGIIPRTPTGALTKGVLTRINKITSKFIIINRRKLKR